MALPLLMAGAAFGLSGEASAEKVLRIAITAADVPTTGGAANQGLEGANFAGYPAFEPLVNWDLRVTDRPPPLVGALATEWNTDPKDPTRWIFKLRQGVKFHDGTAFNADAVIWNLERFYDQKAAHYDSNGASTVAVRAPGVARWEKISDSEVAIYTKTPLTYFPEMITNFLISGPARFDQVGRNWSEYGKRPTGTGPFQVREVTQTSIVFERNPNYWNKDRLAKVDRLVIFPMPEPTTRLAALRSGQVDWIEATPPDAVPSLRAAGFKVETTRFPHVWPYWLMTEKGSPFADVRVRQAANYAIDRDALVALLNGTAEPAYGFWKRGDPRFGNPKNSYTYDPKKARQLLAEAGYPAGQLVKVKFLIPSSGSGQMQSLPMNELVQQSMREAGFDVEFLVVERGQFRVLSRQTPDAPQMRGVTGVNASLTTGDTSWLFISFDKPNWGKWENEEAQALMAKVRTDFAAQSDVKIWARIHEILVDDAPWIWVVHDGNPRAFTSKVKGFTPAQSWFYDLTTISMDD